MNRREFLNAIPGGILLANAMPQSATNGVMLMNRIGPSGSELYIANIDGTNERKFLERSTFDYHASYSSDGKWVVFTSERNGDGQSDIFRARPDGTGVEPLVTGPSMDDAGVLSSAGSSLAFVSTRDGYKANIWTLELATGRLRNLTGASERVSENTPEFSLGQRSSGAEARGFQFMMGERRLGARGFYWSTTISNVADYIRQYGRRHRPRGPATHLRALLARRESESSRSAAGVGFPIARHIAEQHGATLIVESEVGSGSLFTLCLPLSLVSC